LVQSVFKSMEWPNEWRGWRPPFIGPTGNLPVGVSEIRTCRDWDQTYLTNVSGTRSWHRTCSVQGLNRRKSRWARHVRSRDWICLMIVSGTQRPSQICPAKGISRWTKEVTRYVWSRCWTYPTNFSRTWHRGRISPAI
jgi:CRISPR/Cas system-associated exonuclease Cas4 (RecB family)